MSKDNHLCSRCLADPQPSNFLSPRGCAFNGDGNFDPSNWNCATLDEILTRVPEKEHGGGEHGGDDETMQVVPFIVEYTADEFFGGGPERTTTGFIVLNRYKRSGCTSSAVWVGNFWPPKTLTLQIAEKFIAREFVDR